MSDKLTIEYVPLNLALLWDDNKKRHDIEALIKSFKRHGFKDSPKFEPQLNKGDGGIVEGNGRFIALDAMRNAGDDPPRGIAVDDNGGWLVPVTFGVDAASEAAAKSYGVDHNALTLSGGDFDLTDHMRMWEADFEQQLAELAQMDEAPVAFDVGDIEALLALSQEPPEDPGAQIDKAEELRKKWGVESGQLWGIGRYTICPKCGRLHKLD
jgi:hypothetical protein